MTYDKETAHQEIREVIAAWVLDPTLPEPEFQRCIVGDWLDKSMAHIFHSLRTEIDPVIRLKPKPQPTIRVNGVEVPAPETVAPAVGDMYYVANLAGENLYVCHHWCDDKADIEWLDKGLAYLTAENAIARSEAMLLYEVVV